MNLRVLVALCALMAWPIWGIWCMMSAYLAALTLVVALAAGVGASPTWPCYGGEGTLPDGTKVHYTLCQFSEPTVDGFVVVFGDDGWIYYAELDARGEYEASPYRVGIDDPYEIGIPKALQPQRSAVRQAEIDAEWLLSSYGSGYLHHLTQPDGTWFSAYWDHPLPRFTISWWCSVELTRYNVNSSFYLKSKVPGDGYVIAVGGEPLINYGDGDPFLAFVHDEESSWYYYAERNEYGNYVFDAQDEYVASPYKVGIDDPPIYDRPTGHIEPPPTAVQERSWGGVKTLFHQ